MIPNCNTAKSSTCPTLRDMFLVFNRITFVSFGGGLTAWARKILVEEKQWISNEEFLSAYALARAMPGANQVNFAIYIGVRFRGILGAIMAVLGLTLMPFLFILGLAYLYFEHHDTLVIKNLLHGITSVAVGLALSMGLKTGEAFKEKPVALAFIFFSFLGSAVFNIPLIFILLVLVPGAFILEWRRQ